MLSCGVRLPVTFMYYVPVLKLFHHLVATPFYFVVSPYQTLWQHSDGYLPNGPSNTSRYEKNRDFRPISRFISEMVQDRVIVAMTREEETVPKFSNGTIFNELQ